jgi:hypothetical protein
MVDLALASAALLACCVLLWLRVAGVARLVQFRAFRGVVHAAGGIGPLTLDPVSSTLVPRVSRFHLRAPGIDLGEIVIDDPGLGIAAGHTATAIYAERAGHAPQPVLVFNHESLRWRALAETRAALRGDAASHYLPVLVFFALVCLMWFGAASGIEPFHFDPPASFEAEPLVVALASVGLALAAMGVVAVLALRRLDLELERRAASALRAALFSLPETDGARRALLNLAMPRTRRMPDGEALISL